MTNHPYNRPPTNRHQGYNPGPYQGYPQAYAAPSGGMSAMKIGVIAGLIIAMLATAAFAAGFVRFAPEAEGADQAQLVQVPGGDAQADATQLQDTANQTPPGDQTPPTQADGQTADTGDNPQTNAFQPAPTATPEPPAPAAPAPAPTATPEPYKPAPTPTPYKPAPTPTPYKPAPTPTPHKVKPEHIHCKISDTELFVGETTVFTASATPANAHVSYAFDHGDGTIDHRNPSHAYYAHPGTYTVKVKASYGHNEHLTVNCGKVHVKEKHVTPPVNVYCSISNALLAVGETTTFSGSHDGPAHTNIKFWFDHGDGTIDHRNPSHAYYEHPGTYTVKMHWQIDGGHAQSLTCGHIEVYQYQVLPHG